MKDRLHRVGWRVRELWLVWLIVAGVLVVGIDLWVAFAQPSWLLDTTGLRGADLAKARNDFRGTMLTALGGLAVIVGAVVGALNLSETRRQNQATLELQRRAQVTERFTRAIDQLGLRGDDKLDIRLGAIYALEQIARDSAELHWPIMEVLTAYLREHAPIMRTPGPQRIELVFDKESPDPDAPYPPPERRVPADHQAIATVIGRRQAEYDPAGQKLDLHKVDLPGVSWRGANLMDADLSGANLERAHLEHACLRAADIAVAKLAGICLAGADLQGALLRASNLTWSDLHEANLMGANLSLADLERATLLGTNLDGADLRGANVKDIYATQATIESAISGGGRIREPASPSSSAASKPQAGASGAEGE